MSSTAPDFSHVDAWVFDLDNTLYPASCRLFDQMHVKMGEYVMRHFNVDYPEAKRMQRELFLRHGTTLRGLMVEHGHSPDGFLESVHDIDYSSVPHNPRLLTALERLPGRKIVFTNGTSKHARNVMERLGVADAFHGVFDIVDSDHIPKPAPTPYAKFLREHGVNPARGAFFEDIANNLQVPHDLGMKTVLVMSEDVDDVKDWQGDRNARWVDHVTHDLAGFLSELQFGD
jgi:putative hydrolase of the HAD superfamily